MMRKFLVRGYKVDNGEEVKSVMTLKKIGDEIEIRHVGLKAPYREMAHAAIKEFVDERLKEEIKGLWKQRRYSFKIDEEFGMSGCRDVFIKTLVDKEFNAIDKKHLLHISMYNKINVGIKCWLGDLPLIIGELEPESIRINDDYVDVEDIHVQELEIEDIGSFNDPVEFEDEGVLDVFMDML